MIIAVTGLCCDPEGRRCSAGAGKSTVANRLVAAHGFTEVGLADPLKRFVMSVYDFSTEQMWGSSEFRNRPDLRYPREAHVLDEQTNTCACCGAAHFDDSGWEPKQCYLSPRFALQQLGTEWGRHCYEHTWLQIVLRTAKQLETGHFVYDPKEGLKPRRAEWPRVSGHVVVSDVRFRNERRKLHDVGAVLVRVRRPVSQVLSSTHASENDLLEVPDSKFDFVLQGLPQDVPDLQRKTDALVVGLKGLYKL